MVVFDFFVTLFNVLRAEVEGGGYFVIPISSTRRNENSEQFVKTADLIMAGNENFRDFNS